MFKIKFCIKCIYGNNFLVLVEFKEFKEFKEFNNLYTNENFKVKDLCLDQTTESCFKKIFKHLSIQNYSGKIKHIEYGKKLSKTSLIINISNGKRNGKFIYLKLGKINKLYNLFNDSLDGKQYEYNINGSITLLSIVNGVLNYRIDINLSKDNSAIMIAKLDDNNRCSKKDIRFNKDCIITEYCSLYEYKKLQFNFNKNNIVKCSFYNRNKLKNKLKYQEELFYEITKN